MKKSNTVLVGFSGGVDSSLAAFLLKKQGYKVIGAFLKTYREKTFSSLYPCKNFSEIGDEKMAESMARFLGIKLIKLDYKKQYRKNVIDSMIKDYSSGLTPNPDILCNKLIKFPFLWKHAKKLKADYIATGHYAKIKKTSLGYELHAGKDKTKDQSYFLYKLNQKDLSHTMFPIGNLTKKQVREIAEKNKFLNYAKPGTKGICFIGKIDMLSFLKRKIPKKKGKILSPEGQLLGHHPGAMYYTIGQRIGPRLGFDISPEARKKMSGRWYIAEKKKNTLIVAHYKHPALKKQIIYIKKFHKINQKQKIPEQLKARIRHLGPLMPGKLTKKANRYLFLLKKPTEAIAQGQSVVLYHKTKVIGGGEIRLK